MTVEKPISNQILRPFTTATNSVINHSQLHAITCNLFKAGESFGFSFVGKLDRYFFVANH